MVFQFLYILAICIFFVKVCNLKFDSIALAHSIRQISFLETNFPGYLRNIIALKKPLVRYWYYWGELWCCIVTSVSLALLFVGASVSTIMFTFYGNFGFPYNFLFLLFLLINLQSWDGVFFITYLVLSLYYV